MKKAIIFGAGNIGRGFIGQLFSHSEYEVVFIDVNITILDKLNADRQYPVKILNRFDNKEDIVANVRGVYAGDLLEVSKEIACADIMATAVGVNALPNIAKPLAEGLKYRWKLGRTDPINLIICENLLNADKYLSNLIKQQLNDFEKNNFDLMVGLVEASIGRMVPVMTPEMQEGNILRVCVEEYSELPVDKDGFKGDIPAIENMNPVSPFTFYIQRKLYIHNMGHALTAYLGRLRGCNYIWEAIKDPCIKLAVLKAMQDSALALSKEHGIKLETIMVHIDDLIYRFGNRQLGDTVNRVGNDTKRKLSSNDRFAGAVKLCVKHGINPVYLNLGIAAAMKFDPDNNADLSQVQYLIKTEGPAAVLKKICGFSEEDFSIKIILEFYDILDKNSDFIDIIEMADEYKRKRIGGIWQTYTVEN